MGLLANSTSGIVDQKPMILVYGEGGLGKTTFLAESPAPYCIDVEGGSSRVNLTRSPKPETFDQVRGWIDELTLDCQDFQTIGLDTADALEILLHKKICKDNGNVDSIVKAAGGYGNGFKIAVEIWSEFIKSLENLRDKRKVQIIVLAHQIVSTYNDPTTPNGYDRYSIKLHESQKVSSARLWFDAMDAVLFAKRAVLGLGETKRAIEVSSQYEHSIFTQGRAAFDAKNRFGLPAVLNLRYRDFEAAMKTGSKRGPKQIKEAIDLLCKEIKKPELLEAIRDNVKEVGNDPIDLKNIEDRVIEILKKGE